MENFRPSKNLYKTSKYLDLLFPITYFIYKQKGEEPDFTEPVILTKGRGGCTLKKLCG